MKVSVLTYNVHGLPWPLTRGRKAALAAIGRELGALRREGRAPDVVLIQEGFEDIGELVRLGGYAYWAKGPQRHDRPVPGGGLDAGDFAAVQYPTAGEGWGKLTGSGLHVLSDFPITAVEAAPYAHCAGWDCLANKGVMIVHLDVPGADNGVDVATTHLNSLDAAGVPAARSLQAHHLQLDAMTGFINRHRTAGAPLIVGGDFNTRNAPDRYYYKADTRPFAVVSEFCSRARDLCLSNQPDRPEPWLVSEDLQAFADADAASIHPQEARSVFDDTDWGPRFSDHDGYLVRYEVRARRAFASQ